MTTFEKYSMVGSRTKIIFRFLLFISLGFFANSCQNSGEIKFKKDSVKDPIRIACVGNSITYGSTIVNRKKNAYPEQLQAMLGDEYQVKNFGVSGKTLLKKGDQPYWDTKAYSEALQFNPSIVYIKLGTNDSKLKNRVHLNEFESDYKTLIQSFKEKNKDVRIVLLLPIPSFSKDTSDIWDPIITKKIIPAIQKVAYETQSDVIDLHSLLIDKENLLPDLIHPSSLGATEMAKRVYESVQLKGDPKFDLIEKLSPENTEKTNFYGYQQYNFIYKGRSCKIVQPKQANTNHNWIWRARFWGHEPQSDIALLERGFYLVYCDVSSLFGSPKAVGIWDDFYQYVQGAGLSQKVALEGMSRGGLIVYNWAAKNPDKVACIYADAPVLDGKSWPGGMGSGKGSISDWQKFKLEYKLTDENSVINFKDGPLFKTSELVKGDFPMLHICGEKDMVVPVTENTRIFAQKIKDQGGSIETIYKSETGHHPHSLKNPSLIVDFILNACQVKTNFALIPSPGSEYRSAAGWNKGKDWWAQKNDIDSICSATGEIDLLLIGNSITQGWKGNRNYVTYGPGTEAAEKHFNGLTWINAGISGDRTEHIAFRVLTGTYEKGNPSFVSLAIGVNNFPFNSAEEIAAGIKNSVEIIRSRIPDAKILLFGPLPSGIKKESDRRKKYNRIHQLIAMWDQDPSVSYFNLLSDFVNEKGDLNEKYYGGDGIHLKQEGYMKWAQFIKTQVK